MSFLGHAWLQITLILSLILGGSTVSYTVTPQIPTTTVGVISDAATSTDQGVPTGGSSAPILGLGEGLIPSLPVGTSSAPIVIPITITLPSSVSAPAPTESTQIVAPQIEQVSVCVPNPILTLQAATSTSGVQAIGYYSTGCALDKTAEAGYAFNVQQNGGAPFSPGGQQVFDIEDSGMTLRFISSEMYPASSTLDFSLTINGTTATTETQI